RRKASSAPGRELETSSPLKRRACYSAPRSNAPASTAPRAPTSRKPALPPPSSERAARSTGATTQHGVAAAADDHATSIAGPDTGGARNREAAYRRRAPSARLRPRNVAHGRRGLCRRPDLLLRQQFPPFPTPFHVVSKTLAVPTFPRYLAFRDVSGCVP